MPPIVSVNGELLRPEDAVVSVFDRGFLYGDSVYEVVRAYRGVPFELDAHLARLEGSAERIAMRLPVSLGELREETLRALRASGYDDAYLRLVVTRGSGEIGLDIALARSPVRVIFVQELNLPSPAAYSDGVRLALVSVRRNLRAAIDPLAKTGNYLNSVLALAEARARGCYEAVMLDHRDCVTEGSSSNIFAVTGGVLITPPLEVGILNGVTRSVVLRVAERANVQVLELPLTEPILRRADEVFITSSIREIVPVVAVDDAEIGGGRPGPVYRKVQALFSQYVSEYVEARLPAR